MTLPPHPPRSTEPQQGGFSLAELIVAVTAFAALGAITSNSDLRFDELPSYVLGSAVIFAALTGGVVGVLLAINQGMRLRTILVAFLVGMATAGLGANAIALRISWRHVMAGAIAVCLVAAVMRYLSRRNATT